MGGKVLFVAQCTYEHGGAVADDRVIAQETRGQLDLPDAAHVLQGHYWPWEIESLYGMCDAALTVRLHAGVFACKQRVPTVALAYEPKVVGFWDSLGLGAFCLQPTTNGADMHALLVRAADAFPSAVAGSRLEELRLQANEYGKMVVEAAEGCGS